MMRTRLVAGYALLAVGLAGTASIVLALGWTAWPWVRDFLAPPLNWGRW